MTQNKEELRGNILGAVSQAVNDLQKCREFSCLMPEVRVNIVFALPGAKSRKDAAAIDGRITVVNGRPHASGLPTWGASDHMARLIIEARKYDKSINAGINFKCDPQIIAVVKKYAREKHLPFGWIDRTKEPAEAADADGNSIPWKVQHLIEKNGSLPVLFYEGDGWGKEPLFFALGSDAATVVGMAKEIARRCKHAGVARR
jgi:predicted fused transcriptional regulator/phosphomethylpyrimidine kinase